MALTRASAAVVKTEEIVGTRNRIINGAMEIDQRNAGASITPTDTGAFTYGLDRWGTFGSQSSKFSVQRNAGSVTPPAGFINYLGITSLAATTVGSSEAYIVGQEIEGFNVADLGWGTANAQPVTLSFWVRSSLTGTFGGILRNADNTRSYPFSYIISTANTWEYKTVTIAGDTTGTWLTNNGRGIRLSFGLGVGSTLSGTAGAWAGVDYRSSTGATSVVGTNGATWYVTGVQLEKGSTATPFERRQFGTELALCQRYLPAIGMGAAGSFVNFMSCGIGSPATSGIASAVFPVSARTAATGITLLQSVGSYYIWTTDGNIKALNALTFYQAGTSGATLVWGAANSTLLVAGGGSNICTGITDIRSGILFTGCEL